MKLVAIALLVLLELTPLANLVPSEARSNLNQWATGLQQADQAEPLPYRLPVKTSATSISVDAKSALVRDVASGQVLYAKNSQRAVPIASITKLITVLVILHHQQPTEIVTISNLPAYQAAEQKLGLANGQRFTVDDLIQASLIHSANDAADALAIYDSGSITAFSNKMTAYLKRWGITDAQFTNANGLADNFMSADSLAKVAKVALRHPLIKQYVARRQEIITSQSGQTYQLTSTNNLLADPRFKGLKTGYTPSAGQSLVGLAEVNGHEIVTVVLNSSDRFAETAKLVNWVETNYQWL